MIPIGKNTKKFYRRMNHFLSFKEYVKRIVRINPKKRFWILKEAKETEKFYQKYFRDLAARNLAGHNIGLCLSWHHYIESRMKDALRHNLKILKMTHPRMNPIKFK